MSVQRVDTGTYLVQAGGSFASCVPTATAVDYSENLPATDGHVRDVSLLAARSQGAFWVRSHLPAVGKPADGGFSYTLICSQ